jgi:hypothetical protein
MSGPPKHHDPVPDHIRQELIRDIDDEKWTVIKGHIWQDAVTYARQRLGMDYPTVESLWGYVLGCIECGAPLQYVQLFEYSDRCGFEMRNANGTGLYIKLRYDDESQLVLMSFHG